MLKFDEINAPEDATLACRNNFHEQLDSTPSLNGLHQSKGTHNVCGLLTPFDDLSWIKNTQVFNKQSPSGRAIHPKHLDRTCRFLQMP